jgi:acetyl esterase/lipase
LSNNWRRFTSFIALPAYLAAASGQALAMGSSAPPGGTLVTAAALLQAEASDETSSQETSGTGEVQVQPDVTLPIPAPPAPPGTPAETFVKGHFRHVSQPALYVYLNPDTTKLHPAVILCPGGSFVALDWHGVVLHNIPWFRSHGFTVLGLKYSLVAPGMARRRIEATAELERALALVRQHAAEWRINPALIGALGVSAGATTLLDVLSAATTDPAVTAVAPAFAILLSPAAAHQDISEFVFSAKTPPLFIASARDDRAAPEIFARTLAQNAQAQGANVLYYAIDQGGHGAFVIGSKLPGRDWTPTFLPWFGKIFNYPVASQ